MTLRNNSYDCEAGRRGSLKGQNIRFGISGKRKPSSDFLSNQGASNEWHKPCGRGRSEGERERKQDDACFRPGVLRKEMAREACSEKSRSREGKNSGKRNALMVVRRRLGYRAKKKECVSSGKRSVFNGEWRETPPPPKPPRPPPPIPPQPHNQPTQKHKTSNSQNGDKHKARTPKIYVGGHRAPGGYLRVRGGGRGLRKEKNEGGFLNPTRKGGPGGSPSCLVEGQPVQKKLRANLRRVVLCVRRRKEKGANSLRAQGGGGGEIEKRPREIDRKDSAEA